MRATLVDVLRTRIRSADVARELVSSGGDWLLDLDVAIIVDPVKIYSTGIAHSRDTVTPMWLQVLRGRRLTQYKETTL